jgi:hypothetical protein
MDRMGRRPAALWFENMVCFITNSSLTFTLSQRTAELRPPSDLASAAVRAPLQGTCH